MIPYSSDKDLTGKEGRARVKVSAVILKPEAARNQPVILTKGVLVEVEKELKDLGMI